MCVCKRESEREGWLGVEGGREGGTLFVAKGRATDHFDHFDHFDQSTILTVILTGRLIRWWAATL